MQRSDDAQRSLLIAYGFLLLGAAARVHGLAEESLWFDELFTAYFSDPTVAFQKLFYERILRDVHPPLYYAAIYLWRSAFGASELVLRSFSALMGLLLLASAIVLTRGWLEPRARALLLTLFATSQGFVLYAQEARSYALLLLFSGIATLLFFRMVEQRRRDGSLNLPSLMVLAAACLLASMTHFFGILLAGALHALLLLQSVMLRRDYRPVIASGLLVLLPFVAWLGYQIDYMYTLQSSWIETTVLAILRRLGAFLLRAFGSFAAVGLMLALVAAAAWLRYRRGGMLAPRRLLLDDVFLAAAAPALVFLGALAISIYSPILTGRNLLVGLPAFLFGVARLLSDELPAMKCKGRALRFDAALAAIGLLLAVSLLFLPGKEQWREASELIRGNPACRGATILVVSDKDSVFDKDAPYRYYLSDRPDITLIATEDRDAARAALARIEASPCPVKLWFGHAPQDAAPQLAAALAAIGLELAQFRIVGYRGNVVLTSGP